MSTALPATDATTDTASTDDGTSEPAPLPSCAACPHPLDEHDPIGVRFCAATTAGGMTRGCVCS